MVRLGRWCQAADLEVVRVVGRGDLDRAGAERRVDVVVGDDGDAAADERQLDGLADQAGVAGIVRVHRDGGVAEHGLGRVVATTMDSIRLVFANTAVADRGELALVVAVVDLDVGEPVRHSRAPVDETRSAR